MPSVQLPGQGERKVRERVSLLQKTSEARDSSAQDDTLSSPGGEATEDKIAVDGRMRQDSPSETDKAHVLAAIDSGKRRLWVTTGQRLHSVTDREVVPYVVHEVSSRKLVSKLKELGVTHAKIEKSTPYARLKSIHATGIHVLLVDQKKVHDERERRGWPHDDQWDACLIYEMEYDEEFNPIRRPETLEDVRSLFYAERMAKTMRTKFKNSLQASNVHGDVETLAARLEASIAEAEKKFVKVVTTTSGSEYTSRQVLTVMTMLRFKDGQPETRDNFTTRLAFCNPKKMQKGEGARQSRDAKTLHSMLYVWRAVSQGLGRAAATKRSLKDARSLYWLARKNIALMSVGQIDGSETDSEDLSTDMGGQNKPSETDRFRMPPGPSANSDMRLIP